jgi:hypothetical protein
MCPFPRRPTGLALGQLYGRGGKSPAPPPAARGAAIYLFRPAAAHAELGDLDGAIETAQHAVDLMGGLSSARGSIALAELRTDLTRQRRVPLVKDFLEMTG